MKIHRRDLLKLGVGSLLVALMSPFVYGQSSASNASKTADLSKSAVDGTVTYNAGWVVPLEDKAGLLDLEAKKTKEKEELNKQKTGATDVSAAKEKPKTFSNKIQDIFTKVKNFF